MFSFFREPGDVDRELGFDRGRHEARSIAERGSCTGILNECKKDG